MINQINKTLTTVETGFNVAGSMPIVGAFSGGLRVAAGKLQILGGVACAIIGFVGSQIASHDLKWDRMARAGVENIIHGGLNIVRGCGEAFLALTVVGSVIPMLFNFMQQSFAPHYTYGSMQQKVANKIYAV